MKMKIRSFANSGDIQRERIVMNVSADHDIGAYVLLCSARSRKGLPTPGMKEAYWFPDKPVKTGDRVVLYTKKGTRSEKRSDDGTMVYFFYWGFDEARWAGPQNCAILVEAAEWSAAYPDREPDTEAV